MPSTVFSADFSPAYSGLTGQIGYRLGNTWRIVAGISELVPGSGIYGVTLPNPATPTYLLMDTGGTTPVYNIQDIDVLGAGAVFRSANFGTDHSGLTDVGYSLVGQSRVAPMPELVSGSGVYGVAISPTEGYTGPVVIDSGETPTPLFRVSYVDIVPALLPLPDPGPGVAADFLDALQAWLAANTNVTALFPYVDSTSPYYVSGAPPFFLGAAPSDLRVTPYGVLTYVNDVPGGYNTSKSYWVKSYLRFAVFDDEVDRLAATIATLRQQLDSLMDNPLAFAEGRQMAWRMYGGLFTRDPATLSVAGSAPLWQRSLSYMLQFATRRP